MKLVKTLIIKLQVDIFIKCNLQVKYLFYSKYKYNLINNVVLNNLSNILE